MENDPTIMPEITPLPRLQRVVEGFKNFMALGTTTELCLSEHAHREPVEEAN